ncbi:MAG: hypothetical protein ACK4L8_08825 [Nitrincola lacisaponensis]|uniref:hypothetical protein n=1 Tax=Nitrincola lacisaponensis TaxID=267850 RepID=UPI00391D0208
MTPQEKQTFLDEFLPKYLASGFGSMPKSEIDLLIFHLLTHTSEYRGKTNYELAGLLKVPESRIKTLRLNSALKYKDINSKAILSEVVLRFTKSEQFAVFDSGKVELSLEDPIEKRELENFLKVHGYHAEYTLNSEVLKISPIRLFELIIENIDNANDEFNRIVQAHLEEAHNVSELMDDTLTLKQKFRKLRGEVLDVSMLKTLVGAAAGAL